MRVCVRACVSSQQRREAHWRRGATTSSTAGKRPAQARRAGSTGASSGASTRQHQCPLCECGVSAHAAAEAVLHVCLASSCWVERGLSAARNTQSNVATQASRALTVLLAGDQRAGMLAGGRGEEEAGQGGAGEDSRGQGAVLPHQQAGDAHCRRSSAGLLACRAGCDAVEAVQRLGGKYQTAPSAADEARNGNATFCRPPGTCAPPAASPASARVRHASHQSASHRPAPVHVCAGKLTGGSRTKCLRPPFHRAAA